MPADSGWRSPRAAEQYESHDLADFAQEFLRRNLDYSGDHAQMQQRIAESPGSREAEMEGLARRWGLSFPIAPDASPSDEPALWSPDVAPSVVLVATDLHEPSGVEQLLAGRSARVLAVRRAATTRDLVIGGDSGRHRLRLGQCCDAPDEAYVAPRGKHAVLRLSATLHFEQWLQGSRASRSSPVLAPTFFQRQRLSLLLAIADARIAAASLRDIAYALVFPRNRPLGGAAWKGSSERRHCQRLLAESRDLSAAGYRHLLTGRSHP